MTEQEITDRLGISWSSLCELARDPEDLARIINLSYNEGKVDGAREAWVADNKAFRGYTLETIQN